MSQWPPVPVDPEISGDPKKLVKECYRLTSFNAGSLPGWDAFRALFLENAVISLRLFPNDPEIWSGTPTDYARVQVDDEMEELGYSETPVNEEWFGFRDVAECRVMFDMQRGDQDPIRCFDIFHLVYRQKRWWISAIAGEIPTDGLAIPADTVRT
jgi:hypothetical protein